MLLRCNKHMITTGSRLRRSFLNKISCRYATDGSSEKSRTLSKKDGLICYAMRHGESEYNKRLSEYGKLYGKENVHSSQAQNMFQLDRQLLDAPLTEKGKEQALQTADWLHRQKPISLVFVSPLERTLETARLAFSRAAVQPNFIVLPELAELFSKICDISVDLPSKQKRYSMMDFHLLAGKELIWQSLTLDFDAKEEIKRLVVPSIEQSEQAILNYYVALLRKKFPDPMEPEIHLGRRAQRAIQVIKEYASKFSASEVAIVSHRRILREFTKGEDAPYGIGFDNCQIKRIEL